METSVLSAIDWQPLIVRAIHFGWSSHDTNNQLEEKKQD